MFVPFPRPYRMSYEPVDEEVGDDKNSEFVVPKPHMTYESKDEETGEDEKKELGDDKKSEFVVPRLTYEPNTEERGDEFDHMSDKIVELIRSKGQAAEDQIRHRVKNGKGIDAKGIHFSSDVLKEALRKLTSSEGSIS